LKSISKTLILSGRELSLKTNSEESCPWWRLISRKISYKHLKMYISLIRISLRSIILSLFKISMWCSLSLILRRIQLHIFRIGSHLSFWTLGLFSITINSNSLISLWEGWESVLGNIEYCYCLIFRIRYILSYYHIIIILSYYIHIIFILYSYYIHIIFILSYYHKNKIIII
jgi:hypothetical protein